MKKGTKVLLKTKEELLDEGWYEESDISCEWITSPDDTESILEDGMHLLGTIVTVKEYEPDDDGAKDFFVMETEDDYYFFDSVVKQGALFGVNEKGEYDYFNYDNSDNGSSVSSK